MGLARNKQNSNMNSKPGSWQSRICYRTCLQWSWAQLKLRKHTWNEKWRSHKWFTEFSWERGFQFAPLMFRLFVFKEKGNKCSWVRVGRQSILQARKTSSKHQNHTQLSTLTILEQWWSHKCNKYYEWGQFSEPALRSLGSMGQLLEGLNTLSDSSRSIVSKFRSALALLWQYSPKQ